MIRNLYWFSWLAFLLSAFVIILGGIYTILNHTNEGVLIVYAGFLGLASSGFLMDITYGIPKGG